MEEQPFSMLTRGADSNPARVEAREEVHTTGDIYFQIFKLNGFSLSVEAHFLPVHINTALNREGVELQFNQSYRFEVTTNPLGKHYITV
jgi:hypothetical protein